jgi:energy-coupling factor transport system ATP-binding protein
VSIAPERAREEVRASDGQRDLLAVEDVSFRYPTAPIAPGDQAGPRGSRPILDGVRLRVRRGEYLAVLGHNGSGKSTLARLLNGLLLPQTGRVLVDGLDTRDPSARPRIRELVGMIFSDPDNQIVATIVEDDVAWGLAARGWPGPRIAERVRESLEAVGLTEAMGRPPHELSGGQRQRLAIAGVLALEPACIVADEPTALLDPRARVQMAALLRRLNRERGLSVVHVTHLLEEAALADRVVVLERGRVALSGEPAVVFADLDRLRALRLVVPELALLVERLRAHGLSLPPAALTPESFVAALEAVQPVEAGR